MKKFFAAVAVVAALVGCAGTQEVRTVEPVAESSWKERRDRWDVIHASASADEKQKENAGTGGSGAGLIDPFAIDAVGLGESTDEEKAPKKGKVKEQTRRRPLQPSAQPAPQPDAQ